MIDRDLRLKVTMEEVNHIMNCVRCKKRFTEIGQCREVYLEEEFLEKEPKIRFHEIQEHTDHSPGFDYLYKQMLRRAKNLPTGIPFIEVGVRSGGSALLALWAINESGIDRPLITVDPYGDKPWKAADDRIIKNDGYGESYWRSTQKLLTDFCIDNELDWWHYRMMDKDFFKVWDSIEIWYRNSVMEKKFGFVYLDSEHASDVIKMQYEWFKPRMIEGGMISVDDIIVEEKDGYAGVYIHEGVNRSYIDF